MALVSCSALLDGNLHHRTRPKLTECVEHPRRKGRDGLDSVVGCHEHDDPELKPGKVLLELKPLITGDERIELASGARE